MKGQIIQYTDDVDEPVEKRGASGARVIIGQKYTTKLDVERTGAFVRDQGAWLSRWATKVPALPQVSEVFATGYIMETVYVPDLSDVDVTKTCFMILDVLESQLWPNQAHGDFRMFDNFKETHRGYVSQLLRDVAADRDLSKIMRHFHDQVNWPTLRVGLVHGDPIIDNVGYRVTHWPNGTSSYGDELVIFDPIPASEPLPHWRCVDVGRIIQSMVGYEAIRYERRGIDVDFDAAVTTVLNRYMPKSFDVNEARACVYLSIVHMLRGVRTTTQGTAARLGVWYLVNKLVKVAESWMR
jgi:hypothetical protein